MSFRHSIYLFILTHLEKRVFPPLSLSLSFIRKIRGSRIYRLRKHTRPPVRMRVGNMELHDPMVDLKNLGNDEVYYMK